MNIVPFLGQNWGLSEKSEQIWLFYRLILDIMGRLGVYYGYCNMLMGEHRGFVFYLLEVFPDW